MDSIPHKTCTRCEQAKPLDQFGKHPWCKPCLSADRKARYATRPEYRASAIEQSRQRALRLKGNPAYQAQIRAGQQRYSQTDRGRLTNRERRKRNYHASPANRAYTRRAETIRRSRKQATGGSYTQADWDKLCAFYDHLCLRCGQLKPLTVDHVVPISLGGSSDIINLQPLCKSCNSAKNNRTIDYRLLLPDWMGKNI